MDNPGSFCGFYGPGKSDHKTEARPQIMWVGSSMDISDQSEFIEHVPKRFEKHGPVVVPARLMMEEGSGDAAFGHGDDTEDAAWTADVILDDQPNSNLILAKECSEWVTLNTYREGDFEPGGDGVHLTGDSLLEFTANVKHYIARMMCTRCRRPSPSVDN
ncbi:unnamed protein product, partial [Meganyctiphanes norvegica]